MSEDPVLGIDLGTTFSAMAWFNRHGVPETIANSEGERTTPSVVFFEVDGVPLVGTVAANQALADPANVVQHIKREMGNAAYARNIGGTTHYPESLSALILKKLRDDASEYLDTEVHRAVISVPAYFKDAQRDATRTAGRIAGLEVLNIINEPTAAAIAYGFGKESGRRTIMVYDFGGGTFDVTIMRVDGNEFTVLSTNGDAHLGGIDVDERIVGHLAAQFQAHHGIDLRGGLATRQDLWQRAEEAKRSLSGRTSVTVTLSTQGKAMRVDLDRELMRSLIADLLLRTQNCMEAALQGARLGWADIDSVLLVGGSTRMPAVFDLVKQVSGREPARDANPDELVARGAALQGALAIAHELAAEAGEPGSTTAQALAPLLDLVVHDVAPHSLGIKAAGPDGKPVNSVILKQFTPVPCERRRVYRTVRDGQTSVQIEVLQGEDTDPFSPALEVVGRAGLTDLPPLPAGEISVAITLRYDEDGVVEVVAEELSGGRVVRQELMQKSGALDGEVVAAMRDQVAADGTAPAADAAAPSPADTAPTVEDAHPLRDPDDPDPDEAAPLASTASATEVEPI